MTTPTCHPSRLPDVRSREVAGYGTYRAAHNDTVPGQIAELQRVLGEDQEP